MVYLKDWEDFEIAAESMFMQNPGKCRFTLKYMHSKGLLQLKFTDNFKVIWNENVDNPIFRQLIAITTYNFVFQCIQYKTEVMPDLKKIEKLTGNLMTHMASNN